MSLTFAGLAAVALIAVALGLAGIIDIKPAGIALGAIAGALSARLSWRIHRDLRALRNA